MVSGRTTREMVKGSRCTKMDKSILVSLRMILNREKDYGYIKEITSLRVLGRITRKKDLVSKLRAVVTNTKGYSKTILKMERENFLLQMETSMMDSFSLAINQAMECIFSKIRINTKAIG